MSKYKIGDKVVMEITDKVEVTEEPWYILSDATSIFESYLDKAAEPLTNYTKLLEEYINDLLLANGGLSNEKEDCAEQARAEGQNEAWELARKIVLNVEEGGFYYDELYKIFKTHSVYDIIKNHTYSEAATKVAEWEKANEEIKVGDIVKAVKTECDEIVEFCVTEIDDEGFIYGVGAKGQIFSGRPKHLWHKTGRHIDIEGLLKQIGGEDA